jgi:oligoendopeptidase F
VHQYLSRPHGLLQSGTPLTLAETASVFAEMLTFERLMSQQTDRKVRLSLLCHKIEDTFATVFRQTAMTRFEQRIHEARRTQGELPVELLNEQWMAVNREMFGDSIQLTDGYGWWWSYIPHFVRSPFYCYAYAFGELLVIALYRLYREQGAAFVPKYIDLLSAGGSGTPDDLLAPLGIDTRQPAFWKKGVGFIGDLVRQAEELAG